MLKGTPVLAVMIPPTCQPAATHFAAASPCGPGTSKGGVRVPRSCHFRPEDAKPIARARSNTFRRFTSRSFTPVWEKMTEPWTGWKKLMPTVRTGWFFSRSIQNWIRCVRIQASRSCLSKCAFPTDCSPSLRRSASLCFSAKIALSDLGSVYIC